jgi:hypothetical protein
MLTMFAMFAGVSVYAENDPPEPTGEPLDAFAGVAVSSVYYEPITILHAAGIVTGRAGEDGAAEYFDPDAKITREEVAALVARLSLGASAAGKLPTSASAFTDVAADDFFSRYIAWGKTSGILNGTNWEQTLFDPKSDIKGIAVVKMILAALGYGAKDEFIGDGWDFRANDIAKAQGLYENLPDDVLIENVATRKDIALLMYNALMVPAVTYVPSIEDYLFKGVNKLTGVLETEYTYFAKTNMLSRVQVEDPTYVDPDGVQVTPYGQLYYRWQRTVTGEPLTKWQPDTTYEKEIKVTITNPDLYNAFINSGNTTYDGVTVGQNATNDRPSPITRLFVNGTMLAGAQRDKTIGASKSPYTYWPGFNGVYSTQAERDTLGAWDIRDLLHQSGMEITWYDRKASPLGEYNVVTGNGSSYFRPGRGEEGAGWLYSTNVFDGYADKAVIKFEYLGEVSHLDRNGNAIVTVNYNNTATPTDVSPNYTYGPQTLKKDTVRFTVYNSTYRIGDKVKVILKSTDKPNPVVAPGYVYALLPNVIGVDQVTALAHSLAEVTKSQVPRYYYWSVISGVDNNNKIVTTSRVNAGDVTGAKTWFSGIYYNLLTNTALRNVTSTFTLYRDSNGYILGGFDITQVKSYGMIVNLADYSGTGISAKTTIGVLTVTGEVITLTDARMWQGYSEDQGTFVGVGNILATLGDIVQIIDGNNCIYIPTTGMMKWNAAGGWPTAIDTNTVLVSYAYALYQDNPPRTTVPISAYSNPFVISATTYADLRYYAKTTDDFYLYYDNGNLVAVVPADFGAHNAGLLPGGIYGSGTATTGTNYDPLTSGGGTLSWPDAVDLGVFDNIVTIKDQVVFEGAPLDGQPRYGSVVVVDGKLALAKNADTPNAVNTTVDMTNVQFIVTSNGLIDISKNGATTVSGTFTHILGGKANSTTAAAGRENLNRLFKELGFEVGAKLRLTAQQLKSYIGTAVIDNPDSEVLTLTKTDTGYTSDMTLIWTGETNTLAANEELTIAASDTTTLSAGTTLIVPSGAKLTVDGTLTVNGNLTLKGAVGNFTNSIAIGYNTAKVTLGANAVLDVTGVTGFTYTTGIWTHWTSGTVDTPALIDAIANGTKVIIKASQIKELYPVSYAPTALVDDNTVLTMTMGAAADPMQPANWSIAYTKTNGTAVTGEVFTNIFS